MKKLYIMGLLAAGIATSCVQTPSIAAEAPASPAKSTKTVALKQTDAKYMLFNLEIDQKTGRPTVNQLTPPTQKYDSGRAGRLIPVGIESVTAGDKNKSLVITGKTEDVENLAATIATLDVRPTQVQIKTEFYEIDANKAGSLVSDKNAPMGNVVSVTADLKKAITDAGAKMVNAPIISTLDNMPAQLSIKTLIPSTQEPSNANKTPDLTEFNTGVFVTPRVNTDKSITLAVVLEVPCVETITTIIDDKTVSESKVDKVTVTMNRRILNKESVLTFVDDQKIKDGKRTFVVITPTII